MTTLFDFVETEIENTFIKCAEAINEGALDLTEEELLGVPMFLFRASTHMINAWQEYVGTGERSADGSG